MATNQTGIAITIKAFLPIGKNLDQQLAALTLVKTAHETSDYAALLGAAKIDEVKTEQKTRRVEDVPAVVTASSGDVFADLGVERPSEAMRETAPLPGGQSGDECVGPEPEPAPEPYNPDPIDSADIPAFLKGKKKAA